MLKMCSVLPPIAQKLFDFSQDVRRPRPSHSRSGCVKEAGGVFFFYCICRLGTPATLAKNLTIFSLPSGVVRYFPSWSCASP